MAARTSPSSRTTPARKPRTRKATRTPAARFADGPPLEVAALSLGAVALVAGAALAGLFAYRRLTAPDDGHAAPDLLGDRHPGPADRAPPAFRPDMDAPMTAAEREALRPPAGPAPTIVAGGFLPNGIGAR